MNKTRRKNLEIVLKDLRKLKTVTDKEEAIKIISTAAGDVENCAEEERIAYDNMAEGLKESARGDTLEQNADDLDCVVATLETVAEELEEAGTGAFVYAEVEAEINEAANDIKEVIDR